MKHEAKENLRHDQGLVDGNTINQFCFWEEWVVGWKQVINSFVGRAGIDIGSIFFIWIWKKHPSMAKLSNYLGFSPPNKVQSIKIIGREQRIQWYNGGCDLLTSNEHHISDYSSIIHK